MRARSVVLKLVSAVAVLTMGIGLPLARASSSPSAPFTDQYATGVIGFCDRHGDPVTSGSLDDAPFVWKAVSSSPAPAGYAGGLAELYAFQPIQYEDPANWSGQQLTGGSWYTNAAHPIAQATNADAPLLYFTQAYPPHWDGYVEIRMYFTAYNTPPENTSYPTAILRVQGNNWSLASGGNVACNSGQATALETKTLPASQLNTPRSIGLVAPGKTAGGKASATTLAGGSRSGSAPTTARASGAGQAAIGALSSGSNGGGLSGLAIALISLAALLCIGALGGAWLLRRRRHAQVPL